MDHLKALSQVQIRTAIFRDLPAITEIYNHAVLHSTATMDTEVKTAAQQESWFNDHGESHPILVAERDGTIVGWASLSPWSLRAGYAKTAENSVYVRSSERGQGIGKALLADVISCARKNGITNLIARVSDGNPPSLGLHRSFGFLDAGILRKIGFKFGKQIDIYILQLDLDAG